MTWRLGMTPSEAHEELQPLCSQLGGLIKEAPLDPKQRAGLAYMVAGYFFGIACAALEESAGGDGTAPNQAALARVVADQIVAIIEAGNKLQ